MAAGCLSIEVFLREKPSVAVIHPESMKLEAHSLECFVTFASGKSRPLLIYLRLKAPRLCFSSCHQSRGSEAQEIDRKAPSFLFCLFLTLYSHGTSDWPENLNILVWKFIYKRG